MNTTLSPLANTPLHSWHAAHGARFGEQNGWQIAAVYSTSAEETRAAQSTLALADVIAMGKVCLKGRGASNLARALFGDNITPGKVVATHSGWVCCLTLDQYFLLSGTMNPEEPLENRFQGHADYRADLVCDVTSAYAGIALLGPAYARVLGRLTSLDIDAALAPGSCAETGLAGAHALLVRPPDSLPGINIYVAWDLAEFVWESLWEAGREQGIVPIGMDALEAIWNSRSPDALG